MTILHDPYVAGLANQAAAQAAELRDILRGLEVPRLDLGAAPVDRKTARTRLAEVEADAEITAWLNGEVA